MVPDDINAPFSNDQGPFERDLRITNFTDWIPTLSALEEVYIVEKYVFTNTRRVSYYWSWRDWTTRTRKSLRKECVYLRFFFYRCIFAAISAAI